MHIAGGKYGHYKAFQFARKFSEPFLIKSSQKSIPHFRRLKLDKGSMYDHIGEGLQICPC